MILLLTKGACLLVHLIVHRKQLGKYRYVYKLIFHILYLFLPISRYGVENFYPNIANFYPKR